MFKLYRFEIKINIKVYASTSSNSLSKILSIFGQASEGHRVMALVTLMAQKFEHNTRNTFSLPKKNREIKAECHSADEIVAR